MTTPERLAVAHEEAVRALSVRAKLAGVVEPEAWAREFIDALRRQGWTPCQPVTALPSTPVNAVPPPTALLDQTRAVLRAARPAEPEEPA